MKDSNKTSEQRTMHSQPLRCGAAVDFRNHPLAIESGSGCSLAGAFSG